LAKRAGGSPSPICALGGKERGEEGEGGPGDNSPKKKEGVSGKMLHFSLLLSERKEKASASGHQKKGFPFWKSRPPLPSFSHKGRKRGGGGRRSKKRNSMLSEHHGDAPRGGGKKRKRGKRPRCRGEGKKGRGGGKHISSLLGGGGGEKER